MPKGVYKRSKNIKRKPHSKETIRKIRESNIGKNKGKVRSVETREKISKTLKGVNTWSKGIPPWNKGLKGFRAGAQHHNWKGGLSTNKDYISWSKNKRNRVIKRLIMQGNSHAFGEWETLKAQYNWTCPCCKRSEPEVKLTEDHIIPLSKGGSDNIENIQPLCRSCNCKKYDKTIKY